MRAERFSAVASRLESTLARCADAPDVEAIHHARTGSRRLDAALDALERETCESVVVHKNAAKLRKLLKKIRRRAGKARDMDVHRGLLKKLTPEGKNGAVAATDEEVQQEIEVLDARLGKQREKVAGKFQHRAAKWRDKLERKAGALLESANEAGDPPARNSAGEVALESFAELCRKMPILSAGNLHEFRKGAKHARYIAEAGDDDRSKQTAKQLKRIQDAVGLWHDWLVLAEEASDAADGQENELVKRVEAKRDRQFASAMRTAERARKELLAEWEARLDKKRNEGRVEGEVQQEKVA